MRYTKSKPQFTNIHPKKFFLSLARSQNMFLLNLYNEYCLPYVIDCACSSKGIECQRKKVVSHAYGKVLEIGMGTGLNLKHYDRSKVEHIWGLEPSEGMRKKAQPLIERSDLDIRWLGQGSESIPLETDSADTILLTWTLCSIADAEKALGEMMRVLKTNGILLFSEHGLAPDETVRVWQNRLNPIWNIIGGGCNLNRDIPALIRKAGFNIEELERAYIEGPKMTSYQYWGRATIPS